jgi:hypothetical protein
MIAQQPTLGVAVIVELGSVPAFAFVMIVRWFVGPQRCLSQALGLLTGIAAIMTVAATLNQAAIADEMFVVTLGGFLTSVAFANPNLVSDRLNDDGDDNDDDDDDDDDDPDNEPPWWPEFDRARAGWRDRQLV